MPETLDPADRKAMAAESDVIISMNGDMRRRSRSSKGNINAIAPVHISSIGERIGSRISSLRSY